MTKSTQHHAREIANILMGINTSYPGLRDLNDNTLDRLVDHAHTEQTKRTYRHYYRTKITTILRNKFTIHVVHFRCVYEVLEPELPELTEHDIHNKLIELGCKTITPWLLDGSQPPLYDLRPLFED